MKELRELNMYNSILEAIARGYNGVTEIADCIHEDKAKCSKYLLTLMSIRLVEKRAAEEGAVLLTVKDLF